MVDGEKLNAPETRNYSLHRTTLLIQRVAAFLAPRIPPVILVTTRRDRGAPKPETLRALQEEANRHRMDITIKSIASFTDGAHVAAGAGIADLIASTFAARSTNHPEFWPDSQIGAAERSILRFRMVVNARQ